MTQDELAENNVLISAIYPLRNILLSEGGDTEDLIDDLIDSKPEVVPGLLVFIESGWKKFGFADDDDETPDEFGELPPWQRGELLTEWVHRRVAGDLLVAAVSAPVPRYVQGSSTAYLFSWGHVFIRHVAGSSLEEIYAAALAWKEKRGIR